MNWKRLRSDIQVVLWPWVMARVIVGMAFVTATAIADQMTSKPQQLTEGLITWDGTWYRDIAQFGYGFDQSALRFFPGFPLLGRFLSPLFAGNDSLALIVLANVFSLAAAVALYRLVRFEKGNDALAQRAVWLLCFFPAAFVLVFGYAESLWLFGAIVCFGAIRSRRWLWAIAAGIVLGLTRPLGVVMALPILIELIRVWPRTEWKERIQGGLAVLSPGIGTGIYMLWVNNAYGDMWLPFSTQSDLRGDFVFPLWRVIDGFTDVFGAQKFGDGLHIPFAVVFIVLAVLTFKYWPVSYAAFSALVLFIALGAENLNSVERYGLNAFPLVMTAAVLLRAKKAEQLTMLILSAGLLAMTTLAWTGAYVP